MASRSATQTDIARALGVAQKTVSRAFATPEAVAPELRGRIQAAARRLGYRPHASARAMRTGRFDHVLVVQSHQPSASMLPAAALAGMLGIFASAGVSLGIARFDDDQLAADGFLPRTLADRCLDGLVVNYDTNVPIALERHLQRHQVPAVWFNARRKQDCVHHDDAAAARMLVERLIALGHRRILYCDVHIAWTDVRHYSRDERRAGYRAAMAAAGLAPRECCPAELPRREWPGAVAAHLRGADAATAVIGYSQYEIAAAAAAAIRAGLQVPERLSLATFAGTPVYLGFDIALAQLDDRALGEAAARLLLARIAQPGRHQPRIAIPVGFDPGASLAQPV